MTPDTLADSDSPPDNEPAASGFALLATCWREPTEQLVVTLNEGHLDGVVSLDAAVSQSELRREYTRLFIGPGEHPCPPYESVYRDRDTDQGLGSVMGASTEAIERWYHDYGLTLNESQSELPDHIATELEFASYLAQHGTDEALEQFLDEHPRAWFGEFLDRVENASSESFYQELARITRDVIDPGGEESGMMANRLEQDLTKHR